MDSLILYLTWITIHSPQPSTSRPHFQTILTFHEIILTEMLIDLSVLKDENKEMRPFNYKVKIGNWVQAREPNQSNKQIME